MTCFSEKNPSAHSRYLKADYKLKSKDIRRLDKVSIPKVKKYVSEIVKFKNAMLKFDKSLFSNNGLHLRSPKLAIPHDFNKVRDQNSQHFNEDLLGVNASAFSFVLCFKATDYSGASNYVISAN